MTTEQLEHIPTADLIPYARNSRAHSAEQVTQLAASIHEFGFCAPILIDEDSQIIAGHGRVMAAQKLKLELVPCRRLEHLSEAQKRAYVIADNRLAENSTWDQELLTNELSDLHADDFDLALLGFQPDDLEKMLGIQAGGGDGEVIPESNYTEQYGVIVVCTSEAEQEAAFNALAALGYNCKVVTT